MELKDQVTNLELSKRLKELGVKQDSLFYYYDKPIFVNENGKQCGDLNQRDGVLAFGNRIVENDYPIFAYDAGEADMSNAYYEKGELKGRTFKGGRYSAFTASELGEMLPTYTSMLLQVTKTDYHWIINVSGELFSSRSKNLADAMAEMLIYLLTNKLLKLK